jgi:hypothetical protein
MILGTSRAVRVFAYPEPVDLRKGYDGLFGLVKTGLGRDPLSGDLFLFASKRRNSCKVLIWDGTGLCIFQNQPSSHYTSFDLIRGRCSFGIDPGVAAARSTSRSHRLQCFAGRFVGSS